MKEMFVENQPRIVDHQPQLPNKQRLSLSALKICVYNICI